jgi:peptidoglycan/xylan/chitin deacetylase (PgdA/CDA1 family)
MSSRISIAKRVARKLVAAVAPRRSGIGLRIFTYHSIQDKARAPMVVSSDAFRRQLEHMSRHFNVITFAQLLRLARADQRVNWRGPLAIVTFDDGYRDNITMAAPILENFGLSACFFVTTGYIGGARRFAWDRGAGRDLPLMSWADVRELRRKGFEIGSHTVTHRRLSELSDEELEAELSESQKVLEVELGEGVRVFAYPFGRLRDYSLGQRKIVGKYYEAASTAIRGLNRPGRLSLLELRRTSVSGAWSHEEFCAEADGVFDFVDQWGLRTARFRAVLRRGRS